MEESRKILMEQIDRGFLERLRLAGTAQGGFSGDLTAVYKHLKGSDLLDREVAALLRCADPLEAALDCWRRNRNRYVFDICFWLARIEAERLCIQIIIIMPPPSSWGTPVRKRREMLTGGQQILYGGQGVRSARNR